MSYLINHIHRGILRYGRQLLMNVSQQSSAHITSQPPELRFAVSEHAHLQRTRPIMHVTNHLSRHAKDENEPNNNNNIQDQGKVIMRGVWTKNIILGHISMRILCKFGEGVHKTFRNFLRGSEFALRVLTRWETKIRIVWKRQEPLRSQKNSYEKNVQ